MGTHAQITYIIYLLLDRYRLHIFFYARKIIFLRKYSLLTTRHLKLFTVKVLLCSKYVLTTYYKVTTSCRLFLLPTTIN